jgi:hypothetical protein
MNGIYSPGRVGETDVNGPGRPFGTGAGNFPLIRFFAPKNQGFPDGTSPEVSCIIALKNNNNEIL